MFPLLMHDEPAQAVGRTLPPPGEADDMGGALARILQWPGLHASERQKKLLIYLVEETTAGRAERLKAYNIATSVLGRNERFDPQIDPVVRIEISHLRRCLERYYLTVGQAEARRIVIPKGSYAPRLDSASDSVSTLPAPTAAVATRRYQRPKVAQVMAVVGALLLLSSLAIAQFRGRGAERTTREPPVLGPGVRLEAFVNASGDPKLDQVAVGLTTEITSALVPFRSLEIYLPARTVTDNDRIDYRLRGFVNQSGGDIRVTTQLLGSKSNMILMARDYSIPAGEVGGAREVARRVAESLGNPYGTLFALEAKAALAQDPLAIRACMLGFYAYMEAWAPESLGRLRDCHETVVRLAPNSSEAWAHLAFLYLDEYKFGHDSKVVATALDRAGEAARRAVAADPMNAWAHLTLALTYWFVHDPTSFSVEADRALELNPNDPLVVGEIGNRRFMRGDYEGGIALVRKALALGAGRPSRYHYVTALYAYLHHDYPLAFDEVVKGGHQDWQLARLFVVAIYGKLGQPQDAAPIWEALRRDAPQATAEPRARMLDRQWAPEIIDGLMEGLEEAGVFKGASVGELIRRNRTEITQAAAPPTVAQTR
jgi:TolB-like protein